MAAKVSDLTRPIDLRRRRLRRRRRIVVAVLVAVAVLLGAAVWTVRYSSLLAVRDVQVQGAGLLTAGQIRAAAQVSSGTPLARVDTAAVAARVAALPPVSKVEVHRSWPSTVRIEVTERTPVYQLRDGTSYYWVDRSGVVFHLGRSADAKLPQALAGNGGQRLLKDLATTVSALSPALRRQTDHLEAATPDSITVVLTGNRRIVWGSADQSPEKSTVATAMLGTRASVYDVSSPDHPTAR